MLDINIINEEIQKLEREKTTYPTCEKLSVLYIVREQYNKYKWNVTGDLDIVGTGDEIYTIARMYSQVELAEFVSEVMKKLKDVDYEVYKEMDDKLRKGVTK